MLCPSFVSPIKTIMNCKAAGSPVLVLMLSVMSLWEVLNQYRKASTF